MQDGKSITVTKTIGDNSISYEINNYPILDAAFLIHFFFLEEEERKVLLQQLKDMTT